MEYLILVFGTFLCPLQDADPHFMSYRIMMMESSSERLWHMVQDIDDPLLRNQCLYEVESIRYNLGEGNTYR